MTEFSNNNFHRGAYLVYFNGIEIPTLDVQVTSGVWKIADASISVAPDKELIRLGKEDRVQVAIFYLDTHYPAITNQPSDFRLLFEGEITGWQNQHTSGGRVMVFQADHHALVLDHMYPFYMTNVDSIVAGATNLPGLNVNVAGTPLVYTQSIFFLGLNLKGKNTYIRRPFDFIENMFRVLISHEAVDVYNGSAVRNFFARWTRLTNFHNRWAPMPFLETTDIPDDLATGIFPVLRAVQNDQTINAVRQIAARIGNGGSFLNYVTTIFNQLYYEFTMNPAPPAVAYDLPSGKILGPPQHIDAKPADPTVIQTGKELKNPLKPTRLLNYVTKPQLIFTVPPMCNIVYPGMIRSYGVQESYIQQPTRYYVTPENVLPLINLDPQDSISIRAVTAAFPAEVQNAVDIKEKDPKFSNQNFLVFPEEYFKGPVVARDAAPSWFWYLSSAYSDNPDFAKTNLSLKTIFGRYAAYEYYRERASKRSGLINTVFNPYVVAGFPGAVFDRRDTGVHSMMYIQNITHSLSPSDMSTSINYTFSQTMDDFFESIRATMKRFDGITPEELGYKSDLEELYQQYRILYDTTEDQNARDTLFNQLEDVKRQIEYYTKFAVDSELDAGPEHPFPEVRARFQKIEKAEECYKNLFHRDSIAPDKRAAFSWKEAIGFVDENRPADVQDVTFTKANGEVTTNIDLETSVPLFVLKDKYQRMSQSFDESMRSVARPICTLEEYIDFYGDRGVRDTPVLFQNPKYNLGATFYVRILDMRAGPGNKSTTDDHGNITDTINVDTREDWTARLLRYRNKVLNDLHPHIA